MQQKKSLTDQLKKLSKNLKNPKRYSADFNDPGNRYETVKQSLMLLDMKISRAQKSDSPEIQTIGEDIRKAFSLLQTALQNFTGK